MKKTNELPRGWAWAKLSELANYVTSGARDWSKYYSDDGVLFVRTEDINTNRLNLAKTARMSLPKGSHPIRTRIEQGDLLVTVTGANVGKCAYVEDEIEEAYPSQSVALVKLKNRTLAPYLHKCVIAPSYGKKQLDKMVYGLGRPVLNLDNIRDLCLPIAPFDEQRRIVAKIEELFSELDAGVSALKRAKANLKRYRAAVLKAAFEGKLTEVWRAKHPNSETTTKILARILTERRRRWETDQLAKFAATKKEPPKNWREKYVEPSLPDATKLPDLPIDWLWVNVDQTCEVQGGIQKQPKRTPGANSFPFLRVANVHRNRLELDYVHRIELFGGELERLRLQKNDMLVVEGNGSKTEIGRSAIWKGEIENCVHQNHIIRIRFKTGSSQYLNAYWNSPFGNDKVMNQAASTSGLYTLSVSKVCALPIPLAPIAEQEEIVAEVEQRLSVIHVAETEIDHSLARAARLRQSLLKQAFEGKLVPQDPNDEPASLLLERLRASGSVHEENGKKTPQVRNRNLRKKSMRLKEKVEE